MTSGSSLPTCEWRPIKRGDDIPGGAIWGGRTSTDGDVYVGRNPEGVVGKLNHDHGQMWNIWVHGNVITGAFSQNKDASPEGEILVLVNGGIEEWKLVKRGDDLPLDAVLGGSTAADGAMYACRSKDGQIGKLVLG